MLESEHRRGGPIALATALEAEIEARLQKLCAEDRPIPTVPRRIGYAADWSRRYRSETPQAPTADTRQVGSAKVPQYVQC